MPASVKAPSKKGAQPTFSEQSDKYDYLTAAELDLLLKAAKKTRWSDRDWLAIRMAYRHGLRASELTAIEWTQIDLQGGRIRVNRRKGGRGTEHDLDGDVMRKLRRIKAAQATGTRFVFSSERGGPWAPVSFSRMVERLGKKVLPHRGVHAHMLRHSCGHHLAAKGIDTRRIQDYLGHASIQSTQIYTQLQGNHLKGIWD